MAANRILRAGTARNAMPKHQARAVTQLEGQFAPPKARFFYVVTSLRFFADILYRHVKRALSRRKIILVK
jgi:hypothetical protein